MVSTKRNIVISDDDQLFKDVYAVFKKWDSILLRIQALLIWEKIIPSIIFNAMIHLIFWLIVLSKQSFLSLFCYFMLLFVACDFLSHWLTFLFDDASAPDSFDCFVKSALESGYILSTKELSRRLAGLVYQVMHVLNRLAPPNRSRRFLSFLMTSCLSVACIALGRSFSGRSFCYGLLNLLLAYPILVHYNIFARLLTVVQRVVARLEAEFDRYPLELQSDREAEEAALYEPIVAAAAMAKIHANSPAGSGECGRAASQGAIAGQTDLEVEGLQPEGNNSDDLSTSEAVFVSQFVPKLSNVEIDRLFTDALSGDQAGYHQQRQHLPRRTSDSSSRSSSAIDPNLPGPVMMDEYATDDDEQSIEEEILCVDQQEPEVQDVPAALKDDFVFLARTAD